MEIFKNITPSFIVNIAFSAAVIAALITSLFSFKAMRETNKQLIQLERMRISADINAFRYTKIYLVLEEIQNLPAIDYTFLKQEGETFAQDKSLFKKVIEQISERYGRIRNLHDKVRPLINAKLLIHIETLMKEEQRQSNMLVKSLYENQPLPQNIDVVTLSDVRRKIENELKRILAIQISVLTNQVEQEVLDETTPPIQSKDSEATGIPLESTKSAESGITTIDTEEYISSLEIRSPVNTEVLIDGVKFMEIDHNSGSDYAKKYDVKIPASCEIIFTSKGFKITRSLGEICRFRQEKCILRIGQDANDDIRITHDQYISSFGDDSDVPRLIETLLTHPVQYARAWSAVCLGKIGGKSAVTSLRKALEDPDVWVRAKSAAALAEIGDTLVLNDIKSAYDSLTHEEKRSYGYMFEAALKVLQKK